MSGIVVLVCGGRSFSDRGFLFLALDSLNTLYSIGKIIHGGAGSIIYSPDGRMLTIGADTLAGEWAHKRGVDCEEFPANWEKYGKSAGPRRNELMIERGRPDMVVSFPGGRGTEDMVLRAKKHLIQVRTFDV